MGREEMGRGRSGVEALLGWLREGEDRSSLQGRGGECPAPAGLPGSGRHHGMCPARKMARALLVPCGPWGLDVSLQSPRVPPKAGGIGGAERFRIKRPQRGDIKMFLRSTRLLARGTKDSTSGDGKAESGAQR